MENYQVLLKNPLWLLKRKEILERDNYTCKRCGCGKKTQHKTKAYNFEVDFPYEVEFIESYNSSFNIIRIIKKNVFNIIGKTQISQDSFNKKNKYSLVLNFGVRGVLDNYFNGSMENQSSTYNRFFFEEYPNKDILNSAYKQITDLTKEIDLDNIWFVDEKNIGLYEKNFLSLHIHHKCYRSNYQIWNQNNLEYVTLCNICHNTIHKNINIPFYDKYENVSHFMKACDRCNGTGFLTQYSHIQNGLCFKCNGNCYSIL